MQAGHSGGALYPMGRGHHLRLRFPHLYLPRVNLKDNIVQGKNNLYSGAALFLFERIGRLVE